MSALSVLLLGLAMSADAFAAAIGKGAGMVRPRLSQALKAGLIFGLIEATTPLFGWALGRAASNWLQAWDHWIAFALLAGLGLHMIYNALQEPGVDEQMQSRRHGVFALALTGFATSIDAMAVGVGLAFTQVSILWVAAVIGLCTFSMVTLGVMLGRALGSLVGRRAEILGGVVLIGVGIGVVWEHLGR